MDSIPKSIDIKIKGTHFSYVNKNAFFYTENAAKTGAKTWTTPFNKPHLVAHNKDKDPVGRIIDYKIVQLKDSKGEPPNYIELTARITDEDAIKKVLDGRYLTVSTGSRTSRVICSECNRVLNEEGLCDHKKGSFNEDGKLIYWIIDNIAYTECSFVNDPADEYARIDQIKIKSEWMPYSEFLDNRESMLSELILEDSMESAVLTSEKRAALADSVFCYVVKDSDGNKIRKFPAHDAAHVRNALAKLPQSNLSDDVKTKLLASLTRKAKRFNITVSDELVEDMTIGMDSAWSDEDITAMNDFFAENPDFDSIVDEKKEEVIVPDNKDTDISGMKKSELLDYIVTLTKQHEKDIAAKEETINQLNDSIAKKDAILIERENEVNKFVDQSVMLEKKLKDSIISNIIDLKMTDNINDDKQEQIARLSKRSIESLNDSLTDLRDSKKVAPASQEKIENPTIEGNEIETSDSKEIKNQKKLTDDKYSVFFQERFAVEVE